MSTYVMNHLGGDTIRVAQVSPEFPLFPSNVNTFRNFVSSNSDGDCFGDEAILNYWQKEEYQIQSMSSFDMQEKVHYDHTDISSI